MSDYTCKDGVVQFHTPGNYLVVIDGEVVEVRDENFLPVIWDGNDWVLDKNSFSDEDAYDRAMSIL
jgi:hypothetical protein